VERLCREAGLHPVVAEILVRRGVASPEDAARYLQPRLEHLHDPFALSGMAAAVERIGRALESGEPIVVSGDYDVDGITSTALLTHFLRSAGAPRAAYFVPNRFDHGYGLTGRTVAALRALRPALVITVDNGITALGEVAELNRAGIDTVVTDHHLPRDAGVPPGIVINPVQPGCAYPCKVISGCGVAFKLVTALRKHLRERGWWNAERPEPNLKDTLDLVAIATVADVVPLVEENRVLVAHGLAVLNRPRRRPGVEALLAVSRANGRPNDDPTVTARTIGFQIGPRLNAAGRMADGALGVELLLADDPKQALAMAQRLEEENANRRAVGEAMFREAVAAIEGGGLDGLPGIVVASAAFHEGVSGIVASRLVERYHRPVMVLAENGEAYKGSARSVPGLNVTHAIAACAALLEEWGGHAGAGGCRLPKEHLAGFRSGFAEACGRLAADAGPPAVHLDGHLEPGALNAALVEQLARLEPFGHHNEEPTFLVEQRGLGVAPQVLAEKHLKWRVDDQVEMVAWNRAKEFAASPDHCYRVRLGFNEYRGQRRIQLTVEDIRAGR
jgi:single-stranded-DNA-specific exonuclease